MLYLIKDLFAFRAGIGKKLVNTMVVLGNLHDVGVLNKPAASVMKRVLHNAYYELPPGGTLTRRDGN